MISPVSRKCELEAFKRTYGCVTTCVDRLYASIEQPVFKTRCVFHTYSTVVLTVL